MNEDLEKVEVVEFFITFNNDREPLIFENDFEYTDKLKELAKCGLLDTIEQCYYKTYFYEKESEEYFEKDTILLDKTNTNFKLDWTKL